jgi:hypothetical protein
VLRRTAASLRALLLTLARAEKVANMQGGPQLSPVDRKGIQMGTALEGMTRQGVIYAMGYPPPHRTPSLDSERWIDWRNRFNTFAVVFDPSGLVMGIQE